MKLIYFYFPGDLEIKTENDSSPLHELTSSSEANYTDCSYPSGVARQDYYNNAQYYSRYVISLIELLGYVAWMMFYYCTQSFNVFLAYNPTAPNLVPTLTQEVSMGHHTVLQRIHYQMVSFFF